MPPASDRPLLAVVYDLGAAGAAEILSAARPLCDVVFVCDRASGYVADRAPGLAEYARVCDTTGMDAAAAADTVAALRPSGIVTFSEAQLARTAELAGACDLPFHRPETVGRLTDKLAQREALRAAGVDATRCRVVRSTGELTVALAEVGVPAVVKPRRGGAASRDTYRVDRLTDAVELLAGAAEFVVEEMLTGDPAAAGEFWGDRVSVESLVRAGEVHPVNVTGKFALAAPFRETGQFSPSTLGPELLDAVSRLAADAVTALGVRHGATHTEIKLTPGGPRVIEVNGRLGGNLGDLLRRSAGFDVLRATMEVALDRPPAVPLPRRRRLAFQRYLAPPMQLATLLRLDGLDRIRALPGVQRVDEHAHAGKTVDWRRGTEECLAVVYGVAADHEALRATVEAVDAAFAPAFA